MKLNLVFLISTLFVFGCAHQPYVFEDAPVVTDMQDREGSPVPEKDRFNSRRYFIETTFTRPTVQLLDFKRTARSEDVNALDQVPTSSWYTPRLGYRDVSSEEMIKAAEKMGPPQKPFKITKVKKSGSAPGFHIRDARGEKYLLKVDAGEYPGLESMTNFVVSRLFWAFGYNVPEDYSLKFLSEELEGHPDSDITRDDIEATLFEAFQDDDGYYHATASLFLKGNILGHIKPHGTRPGDIHDNISHENLRILRALYVFCSWMQNPGMRSDNSLQVYEGESGAGHTVHYLLDFGEAFGVHGLGYSRQWEGYQHFFSWSETVQHILDLGILRRKWEKIESGKDDLTVYFEANHFDPAKWKEVYPFEPIRKSQPDDDYWAAKILGALTEEHLRALFQASGYGNQEQMDYILETLLKRRAKILDYTFGRVSPLESSGIQSGALQVRDLGGNSSYEVSYFDRGHRRMAKSQQITGVSSDFEISIPSQMIQRAEDYLRVEIQASGSQHRSKRPAQFHLRTDSNGNAKLVGIVH